MANSMPPERSSQLIADADDVAVLAALDVAARGRCVDAVVQQPVDAVRGVPEFVAGLVGAPVKEQEELVTDPVAALVEPDLDRPGDHGALELEPPRGFPVQEEHARPVRARALELPLDVEQPLLPASPQLVARRVGVGVAHPPEALDPGAPLVVLGDFEKRLAFPVGDQVVDIVEELLELQRQRRFGRLEGGSAFAPLLAGLLSLLLGGCRRGEGGGWRGEGEEEARRQGQDRGSACCFHGRRGSLDGRRCLTVKRTASGGRRTQCA